MYKTNSVEIVDIKKEGNLEKSVIDLPRRIFPILSHMDNIKYCIEIINNNTNGKIPVIGYNIFDTEGIIHTDYILLPLEKAAKLKSEDEEFGYVTLEELLEQIKRINNDEYLIDNGLIIGPKNY